MHVNTQEENHFYKHQGGLDVFLDVQEGNDFAESQQSAQLKDAEQLEQRVVVFHDCNYDLVQGKGCKQVN